MIDLKKKCAAESLGTMFLLFFGVGSLLFSYFVLGSIVSAICFGVVYALLYYFIVNVSGCHLNPVVSLVSLLLKKITKKEFFFYILFQLIGCIAAVIVLFNILLFSGELYQLITDFHACNGFDMFSLQGFSIVYAIIFEVIITAIFVFAYLYFTYNFKFKKYSGAILGAIYFILCLIGADLTGTCLNPLRALCPAIIISLFGSYAQLAQFVVFLIATNLGALIAWFIYTIVFKWNLKRYFKSIKKKKRK